jgi:carbamoyl-phosphate synthase large subunit
MNILITGVGGPTPRSFARAIKEIGNYKPYCLYGTDINKYAVGLYQIHLFDKCFLTPKSSEPAYWDFTESIIKDYQIDIAVILPETEVYAWSKRQAEGTLPCKALIPEQKLVETLVDKSILTGLLAPYKLVPLSCDIDPGNSDLKQKTEQTLGYPFWVRSATGSSGLGSFKVNSYQDLLNWIHINPDVHNFMASEYLPGRNLACKLLYYEGELVRAACGERVHYIMARTSPSGVTGNSAFGRLLNDEKIFEVGKKAMDIVFEKTGAPKHGFFTVDLKEDQNGRPYVTEVNVRHVAFTSSFAAGGANLCEDTIRLLDNDPTFDRHFKKYQFEEGLIFLRDVDAAPILMKESDLLKG